MLYNILMYTSLRPAFLLKTERLLLALKSQYRRTSNGGEAGCRARRIFHVAGRDFCGLLSQTIRGASMAGRTVGAAVAQKRD